MRAQGSGLRAPKTRKQSLPPTASVSYVSPAVAEPGARSPEPAVAGGRLYVVATPIGNLSDFSPRAREVLSSVELILAEDTRVTRKLLSHFGIRTPARALHEHNEAREVPGLVSRLAAGAQLALVSDAGTPLLSDPGFRLVRACRDREIPVLAVAGPSAVTAALSVAGVSPSPFTFAGFLPPGERARRARLAELATLPHTLVLFVSPHRLAPELAACVEVLGGEREAALLAEITKLHERCLRGTLAHVADASGRAPVKGEFVLVVGPPVVTQAYLSVDEVTARTAVDEALARGLALPDARREAARLLGLSRRELYELLKRDA